MPALGWRLAALREPPRRQGEGALQLPPVGLWLRPEGWEAPSVPTGVALPPPAGLGLYASGGGTRMLRSAAVDHNFSPKDH